MKVNGATGVRKGTSTGDVQPACPTFLSGMRPCRSIPAWMNASPDFIKPVGPSVPSSLVSLLEQFLHHLVQLGIGKQQSKVMFEQIPHEDYWIGSPYDLADFRL